jgi:hypothetical protein
MPSDDDTSKNPFVRFKEHVDTHIGAGLNNVLNFPSILSETVASSRQLSPRDSRPAGTRQTTDEASHRAGEDVPPHFRRWLNGQQRAVAEEDDADKYYELLAQDYPGEENEAVRNIIRSERFDTFARRSQYSPIRLAERMPRQPQPRDIQSDMDPRLFTYVDAFEDLLAEVSGTPTMDLRARYNMNQMLRRTWPFGESPISWARRLESQGLVKAFIPDYRSLPPPKPVTEMRAEQTQEAPTAGTKDIWQTGHVDKVQPVEDGLFGEIEKAVKLLNQVLDDTTSVTSSFWDPERKREPREPSTENDLYDAVQSAFYEGQRSLAAFFKSLADGLEPRTGSVTDSDADILGGRTVEEVDGMQILKSTEEYVDEYGNKHVRTEVRRTNKEGTVVSTETHYSVRPASDTERSAIEGMPPQQEGTKGVEWADSYEDRQGDSKSGWFWK